MKDKNIIAILITIATFTTWGSLSIYWKQLENINAFEILAFRGFLSVFVAGAVIIFLKEGLAVKRALTDRKTLFTMIASSCMIASNWGIYIWAVTNGKITEASMGYYINPLLNVIASALIFKVGMNKVQVLSVALVILGVANLLIGYGAIPFIALSLAASFCLYGVIRKVAPVSTFSGLFIETLFISIPSTIYLAYLLITGTGTFLQATTQEIVYIVLSGVVTTIPLAGFAYAAKILPLTTVGVIQYISPTITFLIGVFMYKETFTTSHLITFMFIWVALIIYTVDGVATYHKAHKK